MVFLSQKFKDALYFSAEAHDGQYRKGGKVPYIVHPVLVATLVSLYTKDEDVIAAALLHDVMEDCGVSEEVLRDKFGGSVASLVKEVSHLEQDVAVREETWQEKKRAYLDTMKVISDKALVIVACDKMSNMKSYFDALAHDPEKVKNLFSGSPEDYRWYYEQVYLIVKERLGEEPIVKEYYGLLPKK